MNARLLHLLLLIALLALSGCETTAFEAPLGPDPKACDSRLVGSWEGRETDDRDNKEPPEFYVSLEANCATLVAFKDNERWHSAKMTPHFAKVRRDDHLILRASEVQLLLDSDGAKPEDQLPHPEGYLYWQYRLRGDRLILTPVDHRKVAKLIIDEVIQGTVQKDSGLSVFVRGDGLAMQALVAKQRIFADDAAFELQRIERIPAEALAPSSDRIMGDGENLRP